LWAIKYSDTQVLLHEHWSSECKHMGKFLSVIGLSVYIIYDIYSKMFVLLEVGALCVPSYNQLFIEATIYSLLINSFPTSGHDRNQDGVDCGVGSQEGIFGEFSNYG